MKTFVRPFFCGWLLMPALVALAQDNAPATPATVEAAAPAALPATPSPTPVVTAVAPAPEPVDPAAVPAVEPDDKSTLRRLDSDLPEAPAKVGPKPKVQVKKIVRRSHGNDDRVSVLNDARVGSEENVNGDAVCVLGDLQVDGEVQGDAVCVLGDNTINGTVHGEVVAVLGDITLGPKAHVDGKVVSVGGQVHRDPSAYVGGRIVTESRSGKNLHVPLPVQAWWTHALKLGRPLAAGAGLAWLWIMTVVMVGFYLLLALLFPGGIRRTGNLLLERPIAVILTAMMAMIALPVLFGLLLITVVGIPVALIILPTAVVLSLLFGKAAIYGLIGRGILGERMHPVMAMLLGTAICVMLYLVPVIGLALWLLIAGLGLGCSIVTLFSSKKKSPTAPTAPTVPPVQFASSALPVVSNNPTASPGNFTSAQPAPLPPTSVAAVPSAVESPLAASQSQSQSSSAPPPFGNAPSVPRPIVPNATLPRAGFWIRTGALVLDVILVGVLTAFLSDIFPRNSHVHIQADLLPVLALYGVVLWKLRGTTVGGIVCGLRVVRLDGREIDWTTAIVRALGCFLSLAAAGLGFIWVVFDDERQSWHDKIAGTVVVYAPKGSSLV